MYNTQLLNVDLIIDYFINLGYHREQIIIENDCVNINLHLYNEYEVMSVFDIGTNKNYRVPSRSASRCLDFHIPYKLYIQVNKLLAERLVCYNTDNINFYNFPKHIDNINQRGIVFLCNGNDHLTDITNFPIFDSVYNVYNAINLGNNKSLTNLRGLPQDFCGSVEVDGLHIESLDFIPRTCARLNVSNTKICDIKEIENFKSLKVLLCRNLKTLKNLSSVIMNPTINQAIFESVFNTDIDKCNKILQKTIHTGLKTEHIMDFTLDMLDNDLEQYV